MAAEMTATQELQGDILPLGTRNGIEMAISCRAEKTLGKVIARPNSPDLIDGVQIEPLSVYPDDRGFFCELARLGKGLASRMVPDGPRQIQVSMTLTYPGTIKAIHYHSEQTDLWAPISGMVQVFLCDLRRNSRTFGAINTIFAGRFQPWEILIPPGVGHGYKALGVEPIQLVYFTDRHYNPADELRIPYNHPGINYDWETQHK
ncbi:MAG TPA: dTDP-4-dehydrorhamnose 3,5-epimerase family protein [Dongiaceae bacterium]|nr:dTDP-4-dehydrorhamnose 3,5-epimerase family protein [Dongiaceae bacterium]